MPIFGINALSTASERSGQSGFANLVRGTFCMFLNPTAHETRIHWAMTKEDAQDLMSIVSLIHRRLDMAQLLSRA
ncbi:TIGR02391 family protein [Pseudomonas syringae]|uniref:TIGR02391 family protein n=1 Tax=Pseudomonas TaxID=286 RepID=UPI000CD21E48|nr:TIGR02391 family protein [Pseudomonas syringae]UQB22746.1 TIGR02391 family protein [Pseudomonas syringae pv. syringae]